jgi:hypothetical protein
VRRDCVFATPLNGPRLSKTVRRSDDKRFSSGILPNTVTCRSLALVPTRAFWGIYPVPETSGVLLWIRPVGSACVRSIRLRARFRTRCGRRKKKQNLEMHALRAKQRDRLHDANAQSRDPPVYIVASRVDRASFYAVWPCVGRVIRVAKGDHRDPLCRKNICTW